MTDWKLETNGAGGWHVKEGDRVLFTVEALDEDAHPALDPWMEPLRVAAQAAAGPALRHWAGQVMTILNALMAPGGLTERRVELGEALLVRGNELLRQADALPPLDALQVQAMCEVRRRVREDAAQQVATEAHPHLERAVRAEESLAVVLSHLATCEDCLEHGLAHCKALPAAALLKNPSAAGVAA